jgi:hypothetical protein
MLHHVVPANAGDPYAVCYLLGDGVEAFRKTNARGYGSPRTRGRRKKSSYSSTNVTVSATLAREVR